MPTLIVRRYGGGCQFAESLASNNRRSTEQETREILEGYVAERTSVLEQIEASWSRQRGRLTVKQVNTWNIGARA